MHGGRCARSVPPARLRRLCASLERTRRWMALCRLGATEFAAFSGDVRLRCHVTGEQALFPAQGREVVSRAQGHLPDVAGASIHCVSMQGFVRAGGRSFADQDEARISGDERGHQVEAVDLNMRVAQIDLVIGCDQPDERLRLPCREAMRGRRSLRPESPASWRAGHQPKEHCCDRRRTVAHGPSFAPRRAPRQGPVKMASCLPLHFLQKRLFASCAV